MRKINVAVTGPGGFLGRHLITRLKQEKNLSIKLFDKSQYNLFNIESLKMFLSNADVVVHLAAVNRDNNNNLIKINTLGTLNLLEGIVKYCPTAKLIFSSSSQVYINLSVYGISKKFAEELIEYYGLKQNIKSIILRISNIYGPEGKPFYNSVIATYIHQIKKTQPIVINGDGKQKRDYVYVDDVVDAITKCINYSFINNVTTLNVNSGKLTSINDIVNAIKNSYPKPVVVKYNSVSDEMNVRIEYGSNLKTKKLLSWKPKISITEGLQSMLKN